MKHPSPARCPRQYEAIHPKCVSGEGIPVGQQGRASPPILTTSFLVVTPLVFYPYQCHCFTLSPSEEPLQHKFWVYPTSPLTPAHLHHCLGLNMHLGGQLAHSCSDECVWHVCACAGGACACRLQGDDGGRPLSAYWGGAFFHFGMRIRERLFPLRVLGLVFLTLACCGVRARMSGLEVFSSPSPPLQSLHKCAPHWTPPFTQKVKEREGCHGSPALYKTCVLRRCRNRDWLGWTSSFWWGWGGRKVSWVMGDDDKYFTGNWIRLYHLDVDGSGSVWVL